MRNPNRIPEILSNLERIWKKYPDLRLCQLVVIAAKPTDPCPQVFYKEDDKFLEGLLKLDNLERKE